MKKKEVKNLLPFNLQFFADGGDDPGNEPDNNDNDDNGGSDDDSKDSSKEKKFTQEEVTRLMTREKKEGRKAAIKSLGFESEEEAKKGAALLKALLDSQRNEDEKEKEKNKILQNDKSDAEKRANIAESKLSCLLAGVNKDSIDDVLSIALNKVSDDKDLDSVLKDMKKEKRYSSFFETTGDDGKDGTGSDPGHSGGKGGNDKGSYGKNLASRSKNNSEKKSNYFA